MTEEVIQHLTTHKVFDYLESRAPTLLLVDASWNKNKAAATEFRRAADSNLALKGRGLIYISPKGSFVFWECDVDDQSVSGVLRDSQVRLPAVIYREWSGNVQILKGTQSIAKFFADLSHPSAIS